MSEVRVSRVLMPSVGFDYGWRFDIQTETELNDWWNIVRPAKAKKCWHDFTHSSDFQNNDPKYGHSEVPEAFAVYLLASESQLPRFEAFVKHNDRVYQGMLHSLDESGRIFVAATGAYFPLIEGLDIRETRMVPKWSLPEINEIRITQFEGGHHFYVKVDDAEVEIDGQRKWSSQYSAKEAAKEWISQKARRKP